LFAIYHLSIQHPCPKVSSSLNPWRQVLCHFFSLTTQTEKHREVSSKLERAEFRSLVIVPGFMLTLMHPSCSFVIRVQEFNINLLILVISCKASHKVLISSRRKEVTSCQIHKTKKQTFKASKSYFLYPPLFLFVFIPFWIIKISDHFYHFCTLHNPISSSNNGDSNSYLLGTYQVPSAMLRPYITSLKTTTLEKKYHDSLHLQKRDLKFGWEK
jgi:hypothetical protein